MYLCVCALVFAFPCVCVCPIISISLFFMLLFNPSSLPPHCKTTVQYSKKGEKQECFGFSQHSLEGLKDNLPFSLKVKSLPRLRDIWVLATLRCRSPVIEWKYIFESYIFFRRPFSGSHDAETLECSGDHFHSCVSVVLYKCWDSLYDFTDILFFFSKYFLFW